MLATGMTVIAAPPPKPAAVAPAARPRLSGNHFSELPEQVPCTGTGAGTGQDLGEIQNTQAGSLGTDNPADGNQNSTENNDRTRAELVNAPSFQRNQPGFEKQEDGERQLNGCTGPVVFIFNRSNEQRPAVLGSSPPLPYR